VSARYIYPSPPPPTGSSRAGYFIFNARHRDFVGGRVIQDTTTSSASVAGGRTTVKSYSFTTGANATRMRVRVYGYLNFTTSATVYINLNGTDVYSKEITNTTEQLIIDTFISLSASTSYRMNIDFYNPTSATSYTLYITKVFVFIGYPLTSTTETTIASIAQRTDLYVTVNNINVKYGVGVRYSIRYHRKTTATATLKIGATTLSIASADDGDTFQATRDTMSAGDVTVSGCVGASGDIIIIINLFVQYVLRGNQADSRGVSSSWCVVVQEAGHVTAFVWFVTLDGASRTMYVYNITLNGTETMYASASGSDVTFVFEGASTGEMTFYVDGVEDSKSYSAIVSLAVVVITA